MSANCLAVENYFSSSHRDLQKKIPVDIVYIQYSAKGIKGWH